MPETYKNYSFVEVAINLESCIPIDNEHERKMVGDIIDIREPNKGIGMSEMKKYLWLRLEGFDSDKIIEFTNINKENNISYEKRRYCIPLERLPNFDINKALDTNIIYQPFLFVDEETGFFLVESNPLHFRGLIFDKKIGRYL